MNKHLLIPVLLAVSTMAQAVQIQEISATTLAANSAGTSANIGSDACAMVQTSFTLKLSQNVGAAWNCSTTAAAVNAGSTKGKYSFGGSTSGGTVSACSSAPDSTNGYATTPSSTTSGCADNPT
jgi:hypothetical protein